MTRELEQKTTKRLTANDLRGLGVTGYSRYPLTEILQAALRYLLLNWIGKESRSLGPKKPCWNSGFPLPV